MSNALTPMPTRAGTRQLVEAPPAFDPDAWHVMNQRDNQLIADELMYGSVTRKYVYEFNIAGTPVTGISVIGARQLAYTYGGLKHSIISTTLKQGRRFVFTTLPRPGVPQSIAVQLLDELAEEPDFYTCLVELADVKTGNTFQDEATELRFEQKRDGSWFERPHYQKIAQAKAFRNGILHLLPQDVQLAWKARCLELSDKTAITEDVMNEKRSGVLSFAARHAIPVSRQALAAIGFDQIAGLSDAARSGLEPFRASLSALGLVVAGDPVAQLRPREAVDASNLPAGGRKPAPTTPSRTQFVDAGQKPSNEAGKTDTATAAPGGPSGGSDTAAAAGQPAGSSTPPTPAQPGALLLLGPKGENVGEFPDAISWSHAFVKAMEDAFPVDRDALQFANEATLLDASNANMQAFAILKDYLPEPQTQVIQLKRSARGQALVGEYQNDVRAALALLGADEIAGWIEANAPTYATLPAARRIEVERAVAERCRALGVTPPAQRDPDRERADAMIRDLEAIPDVHQLDQYLRSTAYSVPLARFETERPELHQEVIRAEQAVRHGFNS